MRITIIGHNACGKTTLAKNIADTFDIPLLELDRLWFIHGGNNTDRDDVDEREIVRQKIHADVIDFLQSNNSWVSDGFYSQEQGQISNLADQIVFIDIPLWRRQLNHMRRILNRTERHPELSLWQEIYFVYDMIRRTRERKKELGNFCKDHGHKLIHLTSHGAVDEYFNQLAK